MAKVKLALALGFLSGGVSSILPRSFIRILPWSNSASESEKDLNEYFENELRHYHDFADDGEYTKGFAHLNSTLHNISNSFNETSSSYNSFSSIAEFSLGFCYEKGRGVEKNATKAIEYYRKASDKGHVKATTYLSFLVKGKMKDMKRAIELNEKAANFSGSDIDLIRQNDLDTSTTDERTKFSVGDAQLQVGSWHKQMGNINQAKSFLAKVQNDFHNYPEAQCILGEIYYAKGEYANAKKHFNNAVYEKSPRLGGGNNDSRHRQKRDNPHARAMAYLSLINYDLKEKENNLNSSLGELRILLDERHYSGASKTINFLFENRENILNFTDPSKSIKYTEKLLKCSRYAAVVLVDLGRFDEAKQMGEEKCLVLGQELINKIELRIDELNSKKASARSLKNKDQIDQELSQLYQNKENIEQLKKEYKSFSLYIEDNRASRDQSKVFNIQSNVVSYPNSREYAILADCVYRVYSFYELTNSQIEEIKGKNIYYVYNRITDKAERKARTESAMSKDVSFAGELHRNPDMTLEDWRILDVRVKDGGLSHSDKLGYFAVAFKNARTGNIVISHKGTANAADLITDYYIAATQVPNQYADAKIFIESIERDNKDCVISHTGHSLGAFIAEYSAWKHEHKAVTFESPGTKRLIEAVRAVNQTLPSLEDADITTFVAEPNVVNCAKPNLIDNGARIFRMYKNPWSKYEFKSVLEDNNSTVEEHVFSMAGKRIYSSEQPLWKKYMMAIDLSIHRSVARGQIDSFLVDKMTPEHFKEIVDFFHRFSDQTLDRHAITTIVAQFDPKTEMPRIYHRMCKWIDSTDKVFEYEAFVAEHANDHYEPTKSESLLNDSKKEVRKFLTENIGYAVDEKVADQEITVAPKIYKKLEERKLCRSPREQNSSTKEYGQFDRDVMYECELVGDNSTVRIANNVSTEHWRNHVTRVFAEEEIQKQNRSQEVCELS